MTETVDGVRAEGRRHAKMVVFAGLAALLFSGALQAEPAEPVPQSGFGTLLSIQEAVERALESQAEVRAAAARLKKEEALYRESVAGFFPKLGAEIFQAVATGEKTNITRAEAGIEQPLYEGGKILAGKRKHRTRLQSEELKLIETKLDTELGIRVLYAAVLKERELTRIAQNRVKELSENHERIQKLAAGETFTRHELFRVETLLQEAKHSLVKHKETCDFLFERLREIAGIGDGESLDLEPLTDVPALEESVSLYLDAAREHDPVYRLGNLKVLEKSFEKRELQAERFPHISLAVKWDRSRDVFEDTNRMMAGIQGTWNIWDFGRLGGRIAAKTHEIEETRWKAEAEIRDHESKIRELFHEARAAFEKIRLSEALVRERRELLKNGKSRVIAGEQCAAELTDTFLALEDARSVQIEAESDYRVLLVRLDRMTGFSAGAMGSGAETEGKIRVPGESGEPG